MHYKASSCLSIPQPRHLLLAATLNFILFTLSFIRCTLYFTLRHLLLAVRLLGAILFELLALSGEQLLELAVHLTKYKV